MGVSKGVLISSPVILMEEIEKIFGGNGGKPIIKQEKQIVSPPEQHPRYVSECFLKKMQLILFESTSGKFRPRNSVPVSKSPTYLESHLSRIYCYSSSNLTHQKNSLI